MSTSGSVNGQRRSSAQAQLSRSDSQVSLHASPPSSILLTSSAGQPRDDGDGTPSSRLVGVTSFASGPRSTLSEFSKDTTPIAVLKSENQPSDTSSTYQVGFTDQRRGTEVSPTPTLQSSLGDEILKHKDENIINSIDPRVSSYQYSNVVTPSVVSSHVDNRVEIRESVSWITDSKRVDYSTTSCTFASGCVFSSDSNFTDLSFTSVSPTNFEPLPISSTPVLKESIATEEQKSISDDNDGRYASSKHLTSDPVTDRITPSWNSSSVYDILPVISTRFIETSGYFSPSTLLSSVKEEFRGQTNSLDQKETFSSVTSHSSTSAHHFVPVSIDPTYLSPTSTGFSTLSNLPSSISTQPTLNLSLSPNTPVVSESLSLEGSYSDEYETHSSITLEPLSDSTTSTMTPLLPSQSLPFETTDASGGSVSPTSTPILPKSELKTTQLVTSSSVPSSLPVENVTKSSDIPLMTSMPSIDPSPTKIPDSIDSSTKTPPVSTKSIQPSSSVVSTPPSLTPPLTSQKEDSKFTNIAFDPGYPISPSSFPVTSSIKTQPDLDGLAGTDQPAITSRKNSLNLPLSKSVISQSLATARISSTPTLQPSVLPTTSVISDGPGNSTVIPPGKVDANQDDGFLSGSGVIIVGSACGVFVVGVVIIIAVACALRRKKSDKTPKRDPRMDDLWVDIGRGDERLPAPSVGPGLNVYDSQLPVKSDQQMYRATQSYTSNQEGYLSFIVGDLIRVVEVSDHDWWRGVRVKDGATGWFPTYCVEEAQDIGPTAEEAYSEADEDKMDIHGHISSFQIRKVQPEDTRPLVKENVAAHGTLESKDVTDDVASWVKMAASVSMSSLRSIDTIGTCSTINDYSTPVKGVHFRAIYGYKPVCRGEMGLKEGELVVCKERDRNGWMLGVKPKTKEEGWFPAVYVDAVSSEDATLREEDVPATYDLLDSNKLHNANQAWTGIEHKAVRSYTSNILGDLSFQYDDIIIVFQTLANGWWFGCKDKHSGWFPGAYLEMIEDHSENVNTSLTSNMTSPNHLSIGNGYAKDMLPPELSPLRNDLLLELKHDNGKHGDHNSFFSFSASNSPRDSIASSVISDNDLKPLVSPKHGTMDGRFKKAIRPNRKAPAPPTSLLATKVKDSLHVDGTNSLRRPVRRAPAPPTRTPSKGESDTNSLAPESVNGGRDTPTFKKPLYFINGKRPKLVKMSPDTFDDKSLNPVIRPATRGLAPVLSTPSSTTTTSSVHKHGHDAHKMHKNAHEVERRVKPRPLTPLHLLIAENRHSSASRTSYGSNTDTITSDHMLSECRHSPFQDHTKEPSVMSCNLSRSSTPTILHGSGHKGGKTVTTVSPPIIPTAASYDSNSDDLQYSPPSSSPPPPPPPPAEEYAESFNHMEDPTISKTLQANPSNFNNGVPIQNNNNTKKYSTSSDTLTEVTVNPNQHQPFRRMSSNQKVAPSTLPKPRLYSNSNNSNFSSFGKGLERHNGVSEENTANLNTLNPVDAHRRPSEASRSLGPSPTRDSFALVPGKVSEIVHHLNSLSPDSVFPPLHDGTELSLIIPQRKESSAGPHTPNSIDTISPVNPHNGHDAYHQDRNSTNHWNVTGEVPYDHDLPQINQDILQKNTFVPIKDDLHQIEDRVSTFRSLPRPSRKKSKEAVFLTNEDTKLPNTKTDQYFSYFKPTLDEKVTEL